jgi:hypothetical protein
MNSADVTVLVSSSPIISHPSTHIIDETIASIRYHLADSPIFIMCDGVREEQAHLKEKYRQYRIDLVTRMLMSWNGVMILPFPEFTHQAVMTIKTLELVKTPLMLFVEHDTPLVDEPIDWEMLMATVNAGISNHVRLHYDDRIHPDHQHMMCGKLTGNLIKCVQWHQRPHLAHTLWYENVLLAHFTPQSRTWIEDKVYSPVSMAPWEDYRLTVYDPEGTGQNMKRSRDLNGRAGDTKFPPVF